MPKILDRKESMLTKCKNKRSSRNGTLAILPAQQFENTRLIVSKLIY